MATALYRIFNSEADHRLVYVGISDRPLKRFKQHRADKWWWDDKRLRVNVNWFDSRMDALRAEAVAIVSEKPVYNLTHAHSRELYMRRILFRLDYHRDHWAANRWAVHPDILDILEWPEDDAVFTAAEVVAMLRAVAGDA